MIDSLFFALYLNAYAASNPSILKKIFEYSKNKYINGVVVDVKDERYIRFKTQNREAQELGIVSPLLGNLREFVKKLKENNLKPIARFVCFRDLNLPYKKPEWAILNKETGEPWQDVNGKTWLNPYNRELRSFIISLLKEVKDAGFEEIHLDYIRFPSDGDLYLMNFKGMDTIKKEEVLGEFLKEVKDSLKDITITGCSFGFLAYWGKLIREAQNLKIMGKYLDKFAFMLYPSHFGKNFLYVERKNGYFYGREYLIYALAPLRARKIINNKIAVYVQAFNYRAPGFGKDYIRSQIEGAYISGVREFYFWHAGAEYKEAIEAIKEFKEKIKKEKEFKINKEGIKEVTLP